ncbi:MAG: C-GCAxxG-C-C family protein [Anaerosomatales bacterium]|nr:C-GCAxxG-C-C family protein [Anaerosomatales bacterium]MDT8434789.1 C-GCAxxG-C-C family protein [Anaerosomatales bacterium]
MSRIDDAARLFTDGASCSQAVFVAFAPSLGVDTAQALKFASGFGGGMHIGGTCGAATGAVLALGLAYAGDDSASDRHAVMGAVETFFARFGEQVGATECPAVLECDVRTAEGRALVREQGLREKRCLPAVRAAAQIVEEMLVADD